jgi:hypothetical protein
MAALRTADSSASGQGIVQSFQFSTVVDGDTFTGPASPKAFWCQGLGNPGTQAAAGVHATESAGTYTFYPGTDSLDMTLFVLT